MRKSKANTHPPVLIAVGGFPGSGKSTISRRLAADLRIPRLASDEIGESIKASASAQNPNIEATRIGYNLLFRL